LRYTIRPELAVTKTAPLRRRRNTVKTSKYSIICVSVCVCVRRVGGG